MIMASTEVLKNDTKDSAVDKHETALSKIAH